MRFLGLGKKRKAELTEEEIKWNKMWELWTVGQADSPYAELMTYQSEINNGGHDQYFTNLESTGDPQKALEELKRVLSAELRQNLQNAYKAFLTLKEKESDVKAEETLEQSDEVFYENEDQINNILKEYANGITLSLMERSI